MPESAPEHLLAKIEQLRAFVRGVTVPADITARTKASGVLDELEEALGEHRDVDLEMERARAQGLEDTLRAIGRMVAPGWSPGERITPDAAAGLMEAVETVAAGPVFPRDGMAGTTLLGPEIFASTAEPQPNTVINWRGENFTVQMRPGGWIDADAAATWLAERASTLGNPTADALADEFVRTWIVAGAPDPDEAAEGTSSLSRMTDAVDIDDEMGDDGDPTGALEGPGRTPPNVHDASGDPAGVFERDAESAAVIREATASVRTPGEEPSPEKIIYLQRRWRGSAVELQERHAAAVRDDSGTWIVVKSRYTRGQIPVTDWLNEQIGLVEQNPALLPDVACGIHEVAADVAGITLDSGRDRYDDKGVIEALSTVTEQLHRARVVVEGARLARARSRALAANGLAGAELEFVDGGKPPNGLGFEFRVRCEDGRRYTIVPFVDELGKNARLRVEELPAGGPTDYFEPPSEFDIWMGGYDRGQDDAKDGSYPIQWILRDEHARWREGWAREHQVEENDKGEVIG